MVLSKFSFVAVEWREHEKKEAFLSRDFILNGNFLYFGYPKRHKHSHTHVCILWQIDQLFGCGLNISEAHFSATTPPPSAA